MWEKRSRSSPGTAFASINPLTVRSGATVETTTGALTVEPSSVRTPVTRPSVTRISSTLVRRRSSPPAAVNICSRWSVTAPMPPWNFLIRVAFSSGTASPNANAAALPGVAGPR